MGIFASLTFLADKPLKSGQRAEEDKSFQVDTDVNPTNFETVAVSNVWLKDLRPRKATLSLDVEGFIIVDLQSNFSYNEFFDQDRLAQGFAEELRRLLLDRLKARGVYFHECVVSQYGFLDIVLHKTRANYSKIRKRGDDTPGFGQPVSRVHGDYTLDEAHKLVRQLCGERAGLVNQRRFQMLNVWKPLRGPLKDWPLALCSMSSVEEEDMEPLKEIFPNDTLESWLFRYNQKQDWGYLSDQQTHELLVFKSADSAMRGAVPHCSFSNPNCPPGELPRESIEFRVLVVY